MIQEIVVDLARDPRDRWQLTPGQIQQAKGLIATYKRDLGISLPGSMREIVRPDHWEEMTSLARILDVPVEDVILANFYYDALKAVIGCTAFAVETGTGILHARNLDWWSQDAMLARYSAICRFKGAPAGDFVTFGWPGFIGAFSGMAPGRFAVTLNAVLSFDPVEISMPVVLLLRTALESCRTYAEALALLRDTPIPSDCLLLLSGARPGELAVIERTPRRSALRSAINGFVAVTNDYRALNISVSNSSELHATSCSRFDRISALLRDQTPTNADQCFAFLSDPGVKMTMTVQQMVFDSAGAHMFRMP